MAQVPCGLVGHTERPFELVGAHALPRLEQQVDCHETLPKRKVRVVHDGSGRDAELVGAPEALPLITVGDLAQIRIAAALAADAVRPAEIFEQLPAGVVRLESVHQRHEVE